MQDPATLASSQAYSLFTSQNELPRAEVPVSTNRRSSIEFKLSQSGPRRTVKLCPASLFPDTGGKRRPYQSTSAIQLSRQNEKKTRRDT